MALKQVDALSPPRYIKSGHNPIIKPEKGESKSAIITQEQNEKTLTTIPDEQEECTFTTISQEQGDKSLSTIFQEEERDTWTTISLSSSPLSSPLRSRKGMNLQNNSRFMIARIS